jgi:hypothetical protein
MLQLLFFVLVPEAVSSKNTIKGHVPALDSLRPAEAILFPLRAERKHSTRTMKM